MLHKDADDFNYIEKNMLAPLMQIPFPHVLSAASWSQIGRASIAGYCKNKQDKDFQSYASLYMSGQISFFEAVSPVKIANPLRVPDAIGRAWGLSVAKGIADIDGSYGNSRQTKAKGMTRVAIGFFAAPGYMLMAASAPIANLDTIPKCI